MALQRVSRNSDGATGWAEALAAPASIRELMVDTTCQKVGCSVGDYMIVFDDGSQDAIPASLFDNLYTVVE